MAAPATSLPEAAGQTADKLATISVATGQLKLRLGLFTDIRFTFSETSSNEHSVLNWTALMGVLKEQMPLSNIPLQTTSLAIQYVYRTCWNVQSLLDEDLITQDQADAVLDRWNFAFNLP